MKFFKKVLAFGLATIMAVAITACDSKDVPAADSYTGTKEVISQGTWNIGGIGPTTGDAAIYGQSVMNGAQIAVDEINAAGGINGTMIDFRFEDDEHNPERAVNAYKELKEWGMQILLGAVTSKTGTVVAVETNADNMFTLTPSASSVDIITDKANVYQVCFTDYNQGTASAQYISENNMASKVGVIYNSSDAYSCGIFDAFVKEAADYSFEIVEIQDFTEDSKQDFTGLLQKIKDAGAELVFLPIYYTESALILTQANEMGFTPLFFGCDGMDGILSVDNFDTTLAEGIVLLTTFSANATDEATVSFVQKYKAVYNEMPNQFAADAYDGIYILKAAIEASGVTTNMNVSEICDAIISVMPTLSFDGLTGTGMTWEATGKVSKSPNIPKAMVIKDGTYVEY